MDQEKVKLRTGIEALAKQIGEAAKAEAVAALSARVAVLEAAAEAAKAARPFFTKREKK